MPKFLNQSEIYRILQRTLPPDVYPDQGPASGSYSMSDHAAVAQLGADAYSNLERIYDNYWPQTADEYISDWEVTIFGQLSESSMTLQQKRDRVLARIRSRRRATKADIEAVVYSVVPSDIPIDVVTWGCGGGGWLLDYSQLDIETILNGSLNLLVTGGNIPCPPTAAAFGLTDAELEILQEEAYTYEVRIYGYTLSAFERQALDVALTNAEPARSRHIITDALDPIDMIDGDNTDPVFINLEQGGQLLLESGDHILLG